MKPDLPSQGDKIVYHLLMANADSGSILSQSMPFTVVAGEEASATTSSESSILVSSFSVQPINTALPSAPESTEETLTGEPVSATSSLPARITTTPPKSFETSNLSTTTSPSNPQSSSPPTQTGTDTTASPLQDSRSVQGSSSALPIGLGAGLGTALALALLSVAVFLCKRLRRVDHDRDDQRETTDNTSELQNMPGTCELDFSTRDHAVMESPSWVDRLDSFPGFPSRFSSTREKAVPAELPAELATNSMEIYR
jgi:hypothetical protein